MIYERDYDSLTDDEKSQRLQLEQYIKTGPNITERKRDYIFNCLDKTVALNDKTIVDATLTKIEEQSYKIDGLLTSETSSYSVLSEVYEEENDNLFFYIKTINFNTHNEFTTIERFVKKADLITHIIQYDENHSDIVDRFSISELNFIETEKGKIK